MITLETEPSALANLNPLPNTYEFPVLPQIVAFDFGDSPVDSGDSVSATCSIIKGDFPLSIRWSMNGKQLRGDGGISVVLVNKRLSTISVESVSAEHVGNYTCLAENPAGNDSFTAVLNVNGTLRCFYCFILYNAHKPLISHPKQAKSFV